MVSPQVPKRRLNSTQKTLLDAITEAMQYDKTEPDLIGRVAFIAGFLRRSEPEIADMLSLMIKKLQQQEQGK